MKQNFSKLKLNWEFRRAYKKGKSFVNPAFVVYICKVKQPEIRLGITVSKKLGGAVQRNRAKRVITAAFRECAPFIKTGYDYVIVARTQAVRCKSTVIFTGLKKCLDTAGVWVNKNA